MSIRVVTISFSFSKHQEDKFLKIFRNQNIVFEQILKTTYVPTIKSISTRCENMSICKVIRVEMTYNKRTHVILGLNLDKQVLQNSHMSYYSEPTLYIYLHNLRFLFTYGKYESIRKIKKNKVRNGRNKLEDHLTNRAHLLESSGQEWCNGQSTLVHSNSRAELTQVEWS